MLKSTLSAKRQMTGVLDSGEYELGLISNINNSSVHMNIAEGEIFRWVHVIPGTVVLKNYRQDNFFYLVISII